MRSPWESNFESQPESPSEDVSPSLVRKNQPAYYVKEILNDRIYDSRKECLILWDGYDTPHRVPEEKVNDVATDVYNQARRMTR